MSDFKECLVYIVKKQIHYFSSLEVIHFLTSVKPIASPSQSVKESFPYVDLIFLSPQKIGFRSLPTEETQPRDNVELNKKNFSRKEEDCFSLKRGKKGKSRGRVQHTF